MWLNGFNDNLDGYPKVECAMVPCPDPYMGLSQPGAPPDASLGKQGPFGTGSSTPEYGLCPIDKSFDDEDEVSVVVYYFYPRLLSLHEKCSCLSFMCICCTHGYSIYDVIL